MSINLPRRHPSTPTSGRSGLASPHAASTLGSLSFAKRVDVMESQTQGIRTHDDLDYDLEVKQTYNR
jgi:hypothetical protein